MTEIIVGIIALLVGGFGSLIIINFRNSIKANNIVEEAKKIYNRLG